MGERIVLLVVLLGVPFFACGTAYLIESNYEPKWRAFVQEQYPDISREKLEGMPLKKYCREVPESKELEVCGWYPAVQMMARGAVAAVVAGLSLIAGLFFMGYISRGSRDRLVLLFKPGLYLTLIALVFLSLLHSGLFLAALTLGQIATIGHVMVIGMFFIMAVGLGAAACMILLIRAIVLMLRIPPTIVAGRILSEQRGPAFWKYVRDLAATVKALPPENIVVGFENSFFVIDATVRCFSGTVRGRTLYLSLPLCRILNEAELRAILGHELGHFKGHDTKFSRRFAPIYRGATGALESLNQNISESIASVGMMPALSVLSYFFDCFATPQREIARARELAADRVGAEVSSRDAAGSALVKVHAFGDCWDSALQRMRETLNEGRSVPNASMAFGEFVAENTDSSRVLGLDDECLAHPLDTHPPLKARLDSLGVTMEWVHGAALMTTPEYPAVRLIDCYEEIESELTKMERTLMETTGEVSQNARLRCPACGKYSPVSADACSCGLRFGRSMG
jgi:Zn-dependent protease with chaperone function